MGGHSSTCVANAYHEDVEACVTKDRVIVNKIALEGDKTRSKDEASFRRYLNTDPGFVTIQPGSYYSFPQHGDKGLVYVTIKIGLDLKDANFHVANNGNAIVDSGGFLKNAGRGEIWTDIGGVSHEKRWINQ